MGCGGISMPKPLCEILHVPDDNLKWSRKIGGHLIINGVNYIKGVKVEYDDNITDNFYLYYMNKYLIKTKNSC